MASILSDADATLIEIIRTATMIIKTKIRISPSVLVEISCLVQRAKFQQIQILQNFQFFLKILFFNLVHVRAKKPAMFVVVQFLLSRH